METINPNTPLSSLTKSQIRILSYVHIFEPSIQSKINHGLQLKKWSRKLIVIYVRLDTYNIQLKNKNYVNHNTTCQVLACLIKLFSHQEHKIKTTLTTTCTTHQVLVCLNKLLYCQFIHLNCEIKSGFCRVSLWGPSLTGR